MPGTGMTERMSRVLPPSLQAVLSSWKSRPSGVLRCVVMRHTERADAAAGEGAWTDCPDADRWPFDPPATESGLGHARETALELRTFAAPDVDSLVCSKVGSAWSEGSADSSEVHRWVVVSSPYFRCVQTAVEVCKVLGPQVALIIDQTLGEVYGQEVMGESEPENVIRPMQFTRAYCESRGVKLRLVGVGKWPAWPETIHMARGRLLKRFLQYLRRSAMARRSFVLVTHADGVAAALAAMPSTNGRVVEKVAYCGRFVAESNMVGEHVSAGSTSQWQDERSRAAGEAATEVGHIAQEVVEGDLEGQPLLVSPSGWSVRHSGIQLGHRFVPTLAARLRITSRCTGLSEARVAALLKCLPGAALGDSSACDHAEQHFVEPLDDMISQKSSLLSLSTYIFGASEVASGWGSEVTSVASSPKSPHKVSFHSTSSVTCPGTEAFLATVNLTSQSALEMHCSTSMPEVESRLARWDSDVQTPLSYKRRSSFASTATTSATSTSVENWAKDKMSSRVDRVRFKTWQLGCETSIQTVATRVKSLDLPSLPSVGLCDIEGSTLLQRRGRSCGKLV